MKQLAVVVLLLAAACSKKEGASGSGSAAPVGPATTAVATGATDECSKAIDHVIAMQSSMMKELPPSDQKKLDEMMTKVGAAMVKSCRDTKWSKEATDCIIAVQKIDDASACDAKMTPEQKAASDKAAGDVIKAIEAAEAPAHGTATAPGSGSAAGSATP